MKGIENRNNPNASYSWGSGPLDREYFRRSQKTLPLFFCSHYEKQREKGHGNFERKKRQGWSRLDSLERDENKTKVNSCEERVNFKAERSMQPLLRFGDLQNRFFKPRSFGINDVAKMIYSYE